MAIHVNNLQDKIEFSPDLSARLQAMAEAALAHGHLVGVEVGITLADDDYLHELNRDYRGVDAPTDVLSFAMHEGAAEPEYQEAGPDLLGDVVISLERAAAQAEEYGHDLARELSYLAVHGLLHLMGYDHGNDAETAEMRAAEEEILAGQGMNRG